MAFKTKKSFLRLIIGGFCLALFVGFVILIARAITNNNPSNGAEQWSPVYGTTNTVGVEFPIENTLDFSLTCPKDQIVHYIWANANNTVYSIGIQCGERKSSRDPPSKSQVKWSGAPSSYYNVDIEPVMVEQLGHKYILEASKAVKIVTSDKAGILQLGLSGRGSWPRGTVSTNFLNMHCVQEVTGIRGTQGSSSIASQYGSVKNFQIQYKLKKGYTPRDLDGDCPENQEMVESRCVCVLGKKGPQCTEETCENGGNYQDNGTCSCSSSLCGEKCETATCSSGEPYAPNYCKNGECKKDINNTGCRTCVCKSGWHGQYCEVPDEYQKGKCNATITIPGPYSTTFKSTGECTKGYQKEGEPWYGCFCPGNGQINNVVYDCKFEPDTVNNRHS